MYELIEPYIQAEIDPAYSIRAEFIFREIVQRRPRVVLDIGCGRGFYTKLLSMLPYECTIYGIDLSAEHLMQAQSVLVENEDRVFLQESSAYALPFADNSVDLVICSEVLEHLNEPDLAVTEIRRVLKVGGRVLFTVPCEDFPFLWDPLNWILMRSFGTHVHKDIHWLAGIWADHEKLYSKTTLSKLIDPHFHVHRIDGIVSHCWPFTHFLIYGIGKNLVKMGVCKSLNRFSFSKPSRFRQCIAAIMKLPDRVWKSRSDRSTILYALAEKL